ncbi:DUF5825 family protein [Nocardiopsis chromatogenes]|uniref:DUF5825 family protein n=1 Tax=Nocardiopsis chromatogenes TaxID=280239 RepID=UPI000348C947|nr:DUF5825 family protein [Nocardiopsis chromatogenes]
MTRRDAAGPAIAAALAPVPDHRLHEDGSVELLRPVELGADPLLTAHVVRLLRECQAHRVAVTWRARVREGFDTAPLHHLPPPVPEAPPEDACPQGERWRAAHRYGSFYYRVGPSFLLVKDARDPDAVAAFTLDRPEHVRAFTGALAPVRPEAVEGAPREAVDALLDEGLLLASGAYTVALPPRMLHWPVPYNAV